MYNNYSSSEELTESQNFEKFMNAKDSDDEEKALRGKKQGATGFGAAKGSNTKTYPTYGGPSYQSSYNQGGGGGYGATTGYGASGGYGTGYGAYGGTTSSYGGGGGATSGYGTGYGGGGYGSGTGFGASGYGGSGYGGSGYGGSGYGGSGYGGGYGDSNPYAGVDITGYGGATSGYTGGGAGTGYKDPDDDDEYDEDEEEEEPVEFDLASVKKRKEEQKAAKLAEEKRLEEERKEKEERKKYLESLAAAKVTSNKKETKGAKVTFNLGEDDSDNDNNKNISHISEREDDSNESNEQQNRNAKPKPNNKNTNILNLSDDKKVEEDSDEKIVPESEDNIEEEEVVETPKKYEAKKDEIESSYTDDFEASSSKFGSADMGKAAFKLAKSKTNEFEDSSNYLSESKDARYDDKLTDRINQEPKAEATKPAIYTDAKTTTYNKISEQVPAGGSSLTQHYETRIAKDYVYESLLKDEKGKIERLEAQLSLGGEQVRNVQQLIAEKDVTIHKLITQNQNLQKDLDIWQYEAQDFEKKNKIFEVENEDLQKRVEVLEAKLLESESQKRILTKDNEDKTKALKERKTVLEKEFEAKITSELKAQQENEKDLLMMKIEELQDDNKRYQEEIEKFREDARLYKTNFRQKAEADQESKRLKQEIMILELKLKDRDQNKAAAVAKKGTELATAPTRDNIAPTTSGVPELDKEIQMQELLIKGFQKENEKLIVENKSLKKEIEDLNSRLYDENKKVTEIRTKMVHNTDSVLITDKEIDIETKKMLGSENLVSKEQLKNDRERIIQLQRDLQAQEEVFKQREIEMKFELDRLRAQKMNLEAKSAGVNLSNLKQDDESYKQLQATLENEKQRYEAELRDLRGKLKWYIENQDSIAAKEDIIKQKNEAIKKLEEDITKILSDPNANLDAKSKHFSKVSNEDKKRIKQLERDVESLEENLKKRNPGVYDKLKSEKDESALVKELKQAVKKLQDEKIVTEKEYDTKLNDLRQKFDKMRLGYENRDNTQVQAGAAQAKNATANLENVEVLKTRIKELEKEVQDAKNYYLKKAQQLKDNKKGGKVIEKEIRPATKETVKGSTAGKKVQFDIDSELSSDKENVQYSSNTSDTEKINLLNKLVNLPSTPVYALLTGYQNYRSSAFDAFRNNNTTQASNIKNEFVRLVNDTLAEYSQRDQIVQKVKKVDELIVTEHNDPRYTLDTIQAAIYDLVWSEMKKDRSNMTISKASLKMNNFFGGSDDNGDVSGRKLIVLEETLKKKEEELANAQQRLTTLASDNARLEKDKSNLELIIQRLPKNPKSLDFATMEKKLEILERNYRENELELKNAFRKAYGRDPFGTVSEDDVNKMKANYENEIAQLRATIERKNQEITTFRQQMEVILRELDRLRKSRA